MPYRTLRNNGHVPDRYQRHGGRYSIDATPAARRMVEVPYINPLIVLLWSLPQVENELPPERGELPDFELPDWPNWPPEQFPDMTLAQAVFLLGLLLVQHPPEPPALQAA
jgi:hypothetical protein